MCCLSRCLRPLPPNRTARTRVGERMSERIRLWKTLEAVDIQTLADEATVDDVAVWLVDHGAEIREYLYDYYDNNIEPGRYLVLQLEAG